MAIAHWVKRHPEEALAQLEKHERLTYAGWGAALKKHAFTEFAAFPSLTDEERKEFAGEFGGKTWTGLNLYELTKDIEAEWPDEPNRRLLWQVHDIVHRFNTLLLHQTPISLSLAGQRKEKAVTFGVGPSNMHIRGALFGAFWPYSQTVSLVVTGEAEAQLNRLYEEHLPAFTHERLLEESPETDG
jgi:hypothetical protein